MMTEFLFLDLSLTDTDEKKQTNKLAAVVSRVFLLKIRLWFYRLLTVFNFTAINRISLSDKMLIY